MKKLIILSVIFLATGTMFSWSKESITEKPGVAPNTTVAALKLAEAKLAMSKANTKNFKSTLATADGGI